jgi:thiol:disulfide interchange protein
VLILDGDQIVMNVIESYLVGSPLVAIGAAFMGGLLAGLSPCVYPMVPIVSAFIGARSAGEKNRARAFLLSIAYVAGMGSVYSLLGVIAALTGGMFGSISTNPWTLLAVANILILFALNILEAIPFPAWLSGRPVNPAAGGVRGSFLIGAASGLVASPCTSPVLFSLLTFVATTRSVVYGGGLLFTFSIGMGMPLMAVGTFSGLAAALPGPGRWMVGVKKVLGVMLLGLAEYYLIRAGQAWM